MGGNKSREERQNERDRENVCVFVCERERDRDRDGESHRETDRQIEERGTRRERKELGLKESELG